MLYPYYAIEFVNTENEHEEFLYNNYNDANSHFQMFVNDDYYKRVNMVCVYGNKDEKIIKTMSYGNIQE